MMEWSKPVRTADWKSGVLTLDGENKFEIPELTMDRPENAESIFQNIAEQQMFWHIQAQLDKELVEPLKSRRSPP